MEEMDAIGDLLDDDEISSWEEGFMRGYDEPSVASGFDEE